MDPQWLLLMTFYQQGTLFVAARQSASRFHGLGAELRINFCLFPLILYKQPDALGQGARAGPRECLRHSPRIHAELEERFDIVPARPSA